MSDKISKKTLPISDAARFLGISSETLRRWDQKGILKPFRTKGGQRRYSLSTLEAVKSGERKPPRLSISQAARELGVHPETLRRWERDGDLAAERTAGGQRRYSSEEIAKLEAPVPSPLVPPPPSPQVALPPAVVGGLPPLSSLAPRMPLTPPPLKENHKPEPIPIRVRSLEHYRPQIANELETIKKFSVVILGLGLALVFWLDALSPLTRERVGRLVSPSLLNPIVDINDIAGYEILGNKVSFIKFKFPLDVPGLVTQTLTVLGDAVFNSARFLGTAFFGPGKQYFITPTGDASFRNVSSQTIDVVSLNVQNLTVEGSTVGGGGGGPAQGGDADTLEGQSGSYYLDLDNEVGTCANCLTTTEIDESTLTITNAEHADTADFATTSAFADNSDLLDGLDSSQFLRSDTSDSFTSGTLTMDPGTIFDVGGSILNSAGVLLLDDDALISGDLEVQGDLTVQGASFQNGNITLGDTAADLISFVGVINSDLLPSSSTTWDIGSSSLRWGTGYFDNVDANTISGSLASSGTSSSSWTINQDNLSANAETSALAFETGTGVFNAVIQWNASGDPGKFAGYDDQFVFNYPISLFSQVSGPNVSFSSGSLINYGQSAAHAYTQTGALTGVDLDFSTNITVPDSSSGNQTGVLVTLKDGGASASSIGFQTAGTLDYGLDIGGTIGTADIRLSSGATLTNTAGTLTIAEDLVKVGTGTPGSIDSTGSDLYVTGDLEVDGVIYGDGGGLTNITADSAAFADDSNLLDGLDSTQFLRSDTSDSYTSGTLTFDPGTTLDLQGTITNSAGDLTFSDNVQVTGDLTIQGGELFLSPISSSSSTTAGTIYYDSDNDKLYVYSDGAFHRVATDMTAYTATATALLNQDYLELVHNQATNDLLLTAWYFDTLTSQWRTIGNATHTIKHALQNEWDDAASAGFTIDTQGTLEQNLIAYWKLDETSAGTGAVARNDSYSTNHLTDNNTTASGTGKRNNGADLESGNSEFLEITDNSALSTGDIDFTLSAWVNLESKATGQFILSKRDSASVREYELVYYLAADRFEIRLHNSSGTVVCTATANTFGSPSTSTWYFLLAWHDATANTCNISINNGTADSAAETGTVSDTAANFRMGATDTTENGFFDGLIDETSFWKKLLTTQEKTDLYNSGNANTYNTATTSGSSGFIRTQSRLTNVETQPSADFGTGADGAITVSSDTNINATSLIAGRSCADGGDAVNYSVESLTATTADLESNPSTGCLAAGDEVMLINLRGTSAAFGNVGNYETLRIRSIASDVITFETAKTKYYGDNAADDTNIGLGTGNQAVMLQRVPNYTNVTVSTSGTDFTPGEWVAPTGSANNDAGEGGVMFFRATGTVSVGSGALIHSNFKGYLGNFARGGGESFCGAGGRGSSGGESGAAGAGGIDGSTETGGTGYCGGGGGSISATPGTGSASQGGAGGGGSNASSSSGYGDGGGGGYGTAGTGGAGSGAGVGSNGGTNQSGNGGTGNGGSVGGSGGGGGTYGDGSLTDLFFGSGGGASAYGSPDGGGDGGGVIFISANSISVSGSITSTGGQGLIPGSGTACAGGGAGGSIRLEGNILSLGSSLVSAAGGTNDCTGGDGGTGRIATYYVNSYSGSTSPADTSTNQPFYSYGLYHSAPIATPNSTLLESLRWEANLNTYGKISFQTRSGPSSDPTDGSWEEWRPATNGINCATPNCLLLESANTHTNWSGTAAVFEGDVTRNIDMFEDEDEPTATNVTKITTTGFETDTSGTLATSLISYWPMNETSTVAATPVTRNDVKSTNHLTDNRSATSYILSAAGKKGNAADLELSNGNFFEKTDNSELSTGDINFTVAAWVNMESESAGTTQETIISKYDSATVREYSLYYTGATTDRLRVELFDIGGTSRCTVTANNFGAVTTSTWYFVTAWHDATANTCNISINNGTANSAAETGVPADTAANLRLGANSTTEAAFFDGLIDEAGFWKKVLSSTEITDLYNSGNANTYPTSGQYAGATISSTDLSSYDYLTFWVRASQTGNTVKFGFGESAATEQEETVTIDAASTWQKVYWDLSDIAAASRNGVTKIRLTNLTSSANTIYLDNVRVESLLENQDHALITSTPNEYFQYRAIFTTTNTSFQPQLENVYLVYNDGWKLQQPDNNSVRLYNFTGQEQNVRLEAIVFGADLAEWYPTEDLTIEAGDIVSISGTNDDVGVPKIKKSSTSNDQTMLGVISTKAGLELGIPREDRRLVGLSGRVPVKIAPDSAPIVPGDLLTSSSTYPGRAQKATSAGFIVAKALEPWNPQSPTSAIMSFLNLSWADPKVLVDEDGDAAEEVSDPNQDAQTETDNESQTIESTSGEEVDSTGSDNPADENGETSEDPATQKITIPQIEAEEGFFQHLTVAVEAVFERLIAKTAEIVLAYIKDLTVDQLTVSDKTSGQEIVASGEDHLIILNSLVKENSKVFVTFRDPYAPATQYWITDIKEGESFTLTLSEPVGQEARLDYWIVN